MKTLSKIAIGVLCGCFGSSLQAATRVSGSIASSSTWTVAGSPYLIDGRIQVQSGITLTLQPGVVVKVLVEGESSFQGTGSITIYGSLRAVGTETTPIVFTSSRDDNNGGD